MKFNYKLATIILTLFFMNCFSQEEQMLNVNGTIVGIEVKSILLVRPNQDMRYDPIIEIPVVNGKFQYKEKLNYPEAVTLFFGKAKMSGGRYMPLFLENENIYLTIYPEEDFDKNIIQGGKLNDEFKKFKQDSDLKFNTRLKPIQDSISALFKSKEYHSDKMSVLYSELRKAKNHDEKIVIYRKIDDLKNAGLNLSPKAKVLDDKRIIIYEEQSKWRQQYIDRNPNIISYSFFLNDLIYNKETIDIDLAKSNYEKLSKENPNHQYNKLAESLISAIENIKIGKDYIDFSAPDLNGNIVKLSDKIKGKVALLDLWATWCGPCIAKSRTMIPVYNEFKDKGFTIVGVAGEFKNTNRLINFLGKENWPWLNLVELDRKNNIWQKYSLRGGGEIFLIDEKGKIIAIDPTAEEVREKLKEINKTQN